MASEEIVGTTSGPVRGVRTGDVVRFRSVPYAAPPVGPLRYAAPAPAPVWEGVRDASGPPGPNAPQPPRMIAGGLDMSPVIGTGRRPGEDFLTVDVWTPDPGAGGLPVLVFLHGGAFVAGESSAPAYDGAVLAAGGAVLVAANYRLGAEGFLPLGGGATNVGLRDQLAALEWVRDNAAAFGGDPDLVTVVGESAGAMSIGLLLASPRSAGLFRRAVVQSGGAEMCRSAPERAARWPRCWPPSSASRPRRRPSGPSRSTTSWPHRPGWTCPAAAATCASPAAATPASAWPGSSRSSATTCCPPTRSPRCAPGRRPASTCSPGATPRR
ncbi:carboxylesterase family protein [Pseudonocardia sp. ICBG162]|uniref:carboxylesterase family protein n=1 Tax=Pseudonocardia sp. ICBG162 TaxID=2846761 RepID=UPI001CF703B9|nr:carboxylesterase family protein [Pseudonocardia sp. ICBG162]